MEIRKCQTAARSVQAALEYQQKVDGNRSPRGRSILCANRGYFQGKVRHRSFGKIHIRQCLFGRVRKFLNIWPVSFLWPFIYLSVIETRRSSYFPVEQRMSTFSHFIYSEPEYRLDCITSPDRQPKLLIRITPHVSAILTSQLMVPCLF